MIFARHLDASTTIVAAADSHAEYVGFGMDAAKDPESYLEFEEVDEFGLMRDPVKFKNLTVPTYVVTFRDEAQRDAFTLRYGLEIMPGPNRLADKQNHMVEALKPKENDTRTIEQIWGLDKHDKWDRRTDEQKAQQEAHRKLAEEAKKQGGLSGDSFGGGSGQGGVAVTQVNVTEHADGKVTVEGGYAWKFDDGRAPDNEELAIKPDGMIGVYHKVEVTGAKLDEIAPVLEAANVKVGSAAVARNNANGCWFAFVRKFVAEEACEALGKAGFTTELYGVSDQGERLVPKGVSVVDADDQRITDEPRPWHRASEFRKLKKAEKTAALKNVKGDEFIFCGRDGRNGGTLVYIVPARYYDTKDKMFEKPLDIAHLLPPDFVEKAPGQYMTRSRDWNVVSRDLVVRGFKGPDMMFKVWVNGNI